MYLRYKLSLAGQIDAKDSANGGNGPKCLSHSEVAKICAEPAPDTAGTFFAQTNYRVKDPRRSLEFYTGILGMRLLKKLDMPPMAVSIYFLGHEPVDDIPAENKEQLLWLFSKRAVLSLTHNWGSEDDDSFKVSNGNGEPKGYGYISVWVPDVYAAAERFEQLGVNFIKKPDEGNMKGLAYISDPDGYWIQIHNHENMAKFIDIATR